jgi:hypothetical protein
MRNIFSVFLYWKFGLKKRPLKNASRYSGINHWNTLSILRINLKLHCMQNVESDIPPRAGGKRGRFAKVSACTEKGP